MLAESNDFDEILIEFTGGEPTIEFPLIRTIAEWVWQNPPTRPFNLFMATNGTLFDDEMKPWFHANASRFGVGLSLDGTSAMQRMNRGSASEDLDLDFFRTNWPTQRVKMTVSCETISSLAEGIIHLRTGHSVDCKPGLRHPVG